MWLIEDAQNVQVNSIATFSQSLVLDCQGGYGCVEMSSVSDGRPTDQPYNPESTITVPGMTSPAFIALPSFQSLHLRTGL